jgi:lysozyme family protein
MAAFDETIKDLIIDREGEKFTNRPNDRGGPTKFGITLKFFKACCGAHKTVEDLKNLTKEEAFNIYERFIWKKFGFPKFISQDIANKVLDMAINMGESQAFKLLQRACNDFNAWGPLQVDGIPGKNTFFVANNINQSALLMQLRKHCVQFYQMLIDKNPSQEKFKNGWMRRANS